MRQRVLRRIAAAFLLVFAVSALVSAQAAHTTVHVTRTGAKYHTAGCRYLSRSDIPMTLGEASKRFGPCSVYRPPILGLTSMASTSVVSPRPKAPPASRVAESIRCQASTKKGTQCSRNAKAGGKYCWQHGG